MFMSVPLESAVFMGKNHPDKSSFNHKYDKSHIETNVRLVSEQDEISGMEIIDWENQSWKDMSLIGDERIINLQRTKVYVFSDSALCFGKIFENNQWRADGIRVEYFPGFNTLQLSEEV